MRALCPQGVWCVCVCLPPAHRPSRFSGVEAKTTARAWHTQGDKTPDCRMMCRRCIIHALEGSLNPASSRRVVGFAHASEAVRQAEPLLASSHAEINTCGCGDQDHARAHACRYATMPPVTVRIMAASRAQAIQAEPSRSMASASASST